VINAVVVNEQSRKEFWYILTVFNKLQGRLERTSDLLISTYQCNTHPSITWLNHTFGAT